MDKVLHVTNGDAFTARLKKIDPPGVLYTWREMLCEGPVNSEVFSNEFIAVRKPFFASHVSDIDFDVDYEAMAFSYNTLQFDLYKQVVFWFEYDLFCQINLAAAVHFFKTHHPSLEMYLVCSGEIEGQEGLYGLGELTDKQIIDHANKRLFLDNQSVKVLCEFWSCYAGSNHNKMKTIVFDEDELPYLKPCIQAHLERFPNKKTGVNTPELWVLNTIAEHEFISEKQILGHILSNQGFYGFGDLQWEQIIAHLRPLFTEVLHLVLNDEGERVLNGSFNAYSLLKDQTQFGGAFKYDYFYNSETRELSLVNAN